MATNEQRPRTIIITAPEHTSQDWIGRLTSADEVDVVQCASNISHGVELVQKHHPDLVLIDREVGQTESAVRQILAIAPMTLCIAIVPSPDIPMLRQLMTAGTRDVLPAPVVYDDLVGSIRSILAAEAERRREAQSSTTARHKRPGKLILVIAPKGGVGTTTIATNIAVALHQVSKSEVALADFSLQFGDVGIQLNLWSKYTIVDLATRTTDVDDTTLKRVLSQHDSGIHVLLAPLEPEAAARIGGTEVRAVLDHLLDRFAYVVADTWSFFDEVSEMLLRRADEVLLVTTPELPTLKNAKRFLELADRQNLANGHTTIVLNRFPSVRGITLQDVQQQLHHQVGASIPSEGQLVTNSINDGIPIVISHPRSSMAQSIVKLAIQLAGDQIDAIALTSEKEQQLDRKGTGRTRGLWGFARKMT